MTDTVPSRVFPLPGFQGPIPVHHGDPTAIGGADIMVPSSGTQAVVSMVRGTVDQVYTQTTAPNSGGNAVVIKGIDGLEYYYAHLAAPTGLVKGQTVNAGQLLGYADNSGNAKTTPPHLHIGIGKSIEEGLGSHGGIGTGYDAVGMLNALMKQPSANNPNILSQDVQKNLGNNPTVIDVPELHFVPSVPGFDKGHESDIMLNIKKALDAGIDPFVWLGIVSYESGFDPSAVNPKSGACGYAQIYPCIPNLTPEQNAEEGLKRLKNFLQGCNGDMNCALNHYSGGGGQSYIDIVMGRAKAIAGANAKLPTGDTFDPGTGGDFGGDIGKIPLGECPPIILHLALGVEVPFPDIQCLLLQGINHLQDELASWWRNWQKEHIPNIVMMLWGFVFIIIGILLLIQSNTTVNAIAGKLGK